MVMRAGSASVKIQRRLPATPAVLCHISFFEEGSYMIHWTAIVSALVFGLIGIGLTLVGYKLFDLSATKIDVQKELAEKQNIAVAIVVAAVIIGVAMVVTAAISG